MQRSMPFKSLEERMVRYKRECEAKYQQDLENEIRRLKEFELSKLRMDEAQKYRAKLQEYRDEMETLHQDKLRELKLRESEAWERIKNKEREMEKMSFEHRQKILRDEELVRFKEQDIKKSVEIDQTLLKEERERVQKTEKEL